MLYALENDVELPVNGDRLYLKVPQTGLRAKILDVDPPSKQGGSDSISELKLFIDQYYARREDEQVLLNAFKELLQRDTGRSISQEKLKSLLKKCDLKASQPKINGTRTWVVKGIRLMKRPAPVGMPILDSSPIMVDPS